MRTIFTLLVCCFFFTAQAQVPKDAAVMLSAVAVKSPPTIVLSWNADANATEYRVYRKLPTDKTWKDSAILSGGASAYVQTGVTVGQPYEYQVKRKSVVNGTNITAYGYIYTGIEIPQTENRGKILVLIADNLYDPLHAEIKRLQSDMAADGWNVYSQGVKTSLSVPDIKGLIQKYYNSDPAGFKALLILGHIAVPYSGDLAIDGHVPDHQGAWPADMFYGDMDGEWSDDDIEDTAAGRKENWNKIGDGKFDLDIIPSDIELQVGRIDLSNLPVFAGMTEVDLMRRYLDKNHAFRTAQFHPKMKAVVEDNFGWIGGEAFGSSAYRNFAPLVGIDNVYTQDWKTSLTKDTFIWSYGTGGGNFFSASGIISSPEFAEGTVYNSVFTNLFGSYFGDWDAQNNLMRSALASPGMILTCSWSGRPQWLYQHMALGETMGFSTRLSMNDYTAYFRSTILAPHLRLTTPALMGDPTLRMHMNAMPSNLSVSVSGSGQLLKWQKAKDTTVIGYHVYRSSGADQPWMRLTNTPLTDTSYFDNTQVNAQYMVRALYLQFTPSGTYYNLSQGISNPDTLPAGIKPQVKAAVQKSLFAYPNPTKGKITVSLSGEGSGNGEIVIYNQLGAMVLRQAVTGQTTILNLEKLAKGLYTIRYTGQNGATANGKVMRQ